MILRFMMRRIGTVSMLVLFSAMVLHGQGMRSSSPEDRTKRLKEELSLDTVQTAKVLVIYQELQDTMKKVFAANQGGDRQEMMSVMREHTSKADEKISALLTDDQKKKFDEVKKQREKRTQRRFRGD